MKAAEFRCVRCGVKRQLEVHHLTYDRLGAELDTDLEVVCSGCHKGTHYNQTNNELGVYSKLVSEALNHPKVESIADVRHCVQTLCRIHRVPYVVWKVDEAINRIAMQRLQPPPLKVPAKAVESRPAEYGKDPSTAEAAALLLKVGLVGIIKHMPETHEPTPAHLEAGRAKIREQAASLSATLLRPKRRPFADVLDEIFAEGR